MSSKDELAGEIDRPLYGTPHFGVGQDIANTVMSSAWLNDHVRNAVDSALREAAEVALDARLGVPFSHDEDVAIVSSWLIEYADRIKKEASENNASRR